MEETLLVQEEICSCCKGEGYKPANNLVLYEFCPKCKGEGRVDWITNIVSNRGPCIDTSNLNYKFKQHNIHELIRQIGVEYREIGVEVSVNVNIISSGTRYPSADWHKLKLVGV